jgi:hypothetical protein
METVDEEFLGGAGFHRPAASAASPSSVLQMHAHACLHAPQAKSEGKTGLGFYADGMAEHDDHGRSAAEEARRPRHRRQHHRHLHHRQRRRLQCPGRTAASRPSAARRTPTGRAASACPSPCAGRAHPAWQVVNDICAHEDVLTLLAAAPAYRTSWSAAAGHQAGDKTFKVHLDGYSLLPLPERRAAASPRGILLLER